ANANGLKCSPPPLHGLALKPACRPQKALDPEFLNPLCYYVRPFWPKRKHEKNHPMAACAAWHFAPTTAENFYFLACGLVNNGATLLLFPPHPKCRANQNK